MVLEMDLRVLHQDPQAQEERETQDPAWALEIWKSTPVPYFLEQDQTYPNMEIPPNPFK